MKIIVTGASGFIGKNLLFGLPKNWDIVAVYNSNESFPKFLLDKNLDHIKPVKIDFLNKKSLQDFLDTNDNDFDACVYLAANGDPAVSVANPKYDLETNTIALINFLDHFLIKRFIYFSSGAVYDGLAGKVDPSVKTNPSLPYAISKLTSENYIRYYRHRTGSISEYVIIRFFGAFGPYEPSRKIYNKLIKNFAFDKRKEFIVRGDGNNLIDAMYIQDTVKGVLNVINSNISDLTIDLASGHPITINNLILTVARIFKVNRPLIIHEGKVPEYIRFEVSNKDFRKYFYYEPTYTLENGIIEFYEFLKKELSS